MFPYRLFKWSCIHSVCVFFIIRSNIICVSCFHKIWGTHQKMMADDLYLIRPSKRVSVSIMYRSKKKKSSKPKEWNWTKCISCILLFWFISLDFVSRNRRIYLWWLLDRHEGSQQPEKCLPSLNKECVFVCLKLICTFEFHETFLLLNFR